MTKDIYNKTVDLLLDAYNNNELSHGDCTACAVGNICGGNSGWACHIGFTSGLGYHSQYDQSFKDAIPMPKTDLTNEELHKIERAFELELHKSKEGYDYWISDENKKQGQYMGLCAVLDVMKTMVEDGEERKQDLNAIAEKFIGKDNLVTV